MGPSGLWAALSCSPDAKLISRCRIVFLRVAPSVSHFWASCHWTISLLCILHVCLACTSFWRSNFPCFRAEANYEMTKLPEPWYLRILECVHALVSTKCWDNTLFAYLLCPLGNNTAMISSGKMCGCILHSIKQKTTNNELIQLVSSCSFHLPLQLSPNCGVQICSSIHLCIVRSWASVCHPVSLMWSFLV
jgi:hypothetical protein